MFVFVKVFNIWDKVLQLYESHVTIKAKSCDNVVLSIMSQDNGTMSCDNEYDALDNIVLCRMSFDTEIMSCDNEYNIM